MKHERTRALCEDILIPILNDTFIVTLTDMQATIDAMAAQILRLSDMIEAQGAMAKCHDEQ